MKIIAGENKPIVIVPIALEPIEIGLALRAIEPDVDDVIIALERNVPNTIHGAAPRILLGLYIIWDLKSSSIQHRVSSFLKNF
ncbi:hypothetical protein A2Z53_00615 [Candidatus Giovannonibacteria bacterium RIFCSPHIGHO2_02_42_15]|uniref:Uncharacterized protein n=1 Tax=Candidatus Giovannonibacteria bacterium RIFCSPHIGHO2_02_42_15 TaxID=1798329 RepID=A0A1F5VLT8_9BACT|nr:MAG: hypothetical protein A2Z53_00615 [Candidatus Giovannonibacteria bacterium RIFCSPHIGHO2_02_42_15]